MSLPNPPTVEQNFVAALKAWVAGLIDRTGEIDAGHQGKLPHHRSFAGNGERILVIEGRILDAHGDIARRQLRLVEFF